MERASSLARKPMHITSLCESRGRLAGRRGAYDVVGSWIHIWLNRAERTRPRRSAMVRARRGERDDGSSNPVASVLPTTGY